MCVRWCNVVPFQATLGVCIAHPGLSPGPINRRLRRRAQELVFTRYDALRAAFVAHHAAHARLVVVSREANLTHLRKDPARLHDL